MTLFYSKLFLSKNQNLYQIDENINYSCSLMNFWPIDNNLIDIVGGADLTNSGGSFSNDVNQNDNSAIVYNGGFYSVLPGVYFTGDLTISFWGSTFTSDSVFFLFSNANYEDEINFFVQSNTPRFSVRNGSSISIVYSNHTIELNTWYHFAITLNQKNASIFINGSIIANGITFIPNNINRQSNYFGSNQWMFPGSNAKIDFMKFYNRSLSLTEIKTESKQLFNKITIN